MQKFNQVNTSKENNEEVNRLKMEEFHTQLLSSNHLKITTTDKVMPSFLHKVLLIEDDIMSLIAQKKLCSTLTKNIDTALNVSEALMKLKSNHYDLVISDLALPDGSGIDILTWVKTNKDCKNHKTPFVALTARKDIEMHQKAIGAGFFEVSTKPLSKERAHAFLAKYPAAELVTTREPSELPVIDLALAMTRIGATKPEEAIEIFKILMRTIDEDFGNLKYGQEQKDVAAIRSVLHKVRGGFCYTGVPRLEKTCAELHNAVKATDDIRKITHLFDTVYQEVQAFKEEYKKEFGQ